MSDFAVIDRKSLSATSRAGVCGSRAIRIASPSVNRCATAVAAALSVAVFASIATGHEMHIFVQRVEGAAIHGRVYFKGGAAAQGVAVRATDSQGKLLGETSTDADGQFVFVAKAGCDHFFSAELEDGHATRRPVLVRREQLPVGLPGPAASASPASSQPASPVSSPPASSPLASSAPPQPALPSEPSGGATSAVVAVDPPSPAESYSSSAPPPSSAAPSGDLPRAADAPGQLLGRGESAASIAAQLDDIRERLERMETAVRWRDLLGGVGYILGAAGIAFYLMARRSPQESAR